MELLDRRVPQDNLAQLEDQLKKSNKVQRVTAEKQEWMENLGEWACPVLKVSM